MRIISLFVTVIVVVVVPLSVFAQTSFWVENQNTVARSVTPQIDATLSYTFDNSKLGCFAWFLVSETYSEAYFGPTYSPFSWAQIGVGAGLEQTDTPFRLGGFVWVGRDQYSLLTIYEKSKTDYWYKAQANMNLNHWLGVGAIVQRFVGVGPRIQVTIPASPIQIWGAPTYDWQAKSWKGIISVRLLF